MASVEDRWHRPVKVDGKPQFGDDNKPIMERTERYGKGRRWLCRWREPDGRERKLSYAKKTDAEKQASLVEVDIMRGAYIDVRAGQELFGAYVTRWLKTLTLDTATREAMEYRFALYVKPYPLWRTQLGRIKPSTVQAWLSALGADAREGGKLAESTKLVVYAHVNSALNAAVADELIAKNPCKSPSVRKPKPDAHKIVPWSQAWVHSMYAELSDRYKVLVPLGMGVGLRQGEAFGLAVDDVDFLRGKVTVRRQVRIVGGQLVFSLPKGRKTREVPLPASTRDELAAHLAKFPAVEVTLPWDAPGGKLVTARLIVTSAAETAVHRSSFNSQHWRTARERVGIPGTREHGQHMLRHCYASVLLDAGESIKAVSEYLGHASAAFTLRTYTHLMPSSEERTRKAVDAAWCAPSVPQTSATQALTSN